MKRMIMGCLSVAPAMGMALAISSTGRAEDMVVTGFSPRPVAETRTGALNRYLLSSGLLTLGASYLPALVVAIESEVASDQQLYVPVVGPWLDLSERADCEGECNGETVNEVLLATSGVFQGLGALQILGSFIQPETRALTVSDADGSPAISFRVQPTKLRRGSGLIAIANF